MGKMFPAIVIALIAWGTGALNFLFDDGRARALSKARAAKRRYQKSGRRPVKRKGGKLSKAALHAVRLRNLAKARRARRKK